TAPHSYAQPQQFSLQGKEYRFENDKWYTFFKGKKGDEIIPQRLVVRLKNRGQIEVFDFDRLNINGISFGSSRFLNGYYVLLIEQYQDPFNIASALEKSGEFDVLLFDALGKRQCAPDDQSYSTQWNLPIIHMATAWNISVGHSSVLLAIIDSGIDYDHEDLDGNIWVNPAEDINGNGIPDFYSVNQGGDLDGQDAPGDINQKIDDLIGWDFAGDGNDPQPPYQEDFDPDDTDGHGTNVAGISSAQTHNYENGTYRGIAGVAGGWESQNGVSLMVLRDGGEFPIHSLTAQAIEYAAKNGAQVINISTGFSNNWQDVRDAINLAVNNYDVVVVASVGNYGDTGNPAIRYRAKYSNTIAVGATDDNDNRYGYSSYGSEMDVMAPSDVPTTAMGGGYDNNFTGTSASAPHVAGLAGLIRSIDPSLNWTEVRDILRNTADEVPGMGGQNFTNMYGYGRINAREALLGSGAQVNSGAVTQNTTWNGNIIVEGDITVGSSYTLTIQSGTNVVLNNFCDSESSGEETGKAEIIIYGQLDVLGTDVNPVTLKNVIESNVYHWGQIYIGSGGRATIEYADFEDPVRAIKAVSAELVTIDNSTIRGSFDTAIIFESCLSISNRIRDCLIENNEYNGIWLNYSRGSVIGNTVRGNSGIGITGFYGPYFDVSDNIVYNNSGYGVKAFADGSTSIINNTIDSNYGGLMLANPYGETINIINNIISDNDGGGGGINGGGYSENYYNIEYNDVWSNTGGNYTGGISDQTNQNDNISENPDFVGGNPYDYHLQYTSPCIDTGDPNYPADP
ncbi:MAG: S8 family serine peptidase, partial [Candidatus Marinimicrobia bacterium]|nr:S8 family serine peptidase [Candidatus Neomarinimicrobiota bacterium]